VLARRGLRHGDRQGRATAEKSHLLRQKDLAEVLTRAFVRLGPLDDSRSEQRPRPTAQMGRAARGAALT
jgi:hypothetical protein